VQFFAGTAEPLTLLGEDTTAPFTFAFTPASTGAHTIRVAATDNDGGSSDFLMGKRSQEQKGKELLRMK
jgi:hypothetical protein